MSPLLITFLPGAAASPALHRKTVPGPLAGNSERSSLVCELGDGSDVSGTAQEASHQSRIQKSCRRLPLSPFLRFSSRLAAHAMAPCRHIGSDAAGAGERNRTTFATAPCKWGFSLPGTSSAR